MVPVSALSFFFMLLSIGFCFLIVQKIAENILFLEEKNCVSCPVLKYAAENALEIWRCIRVSVTYICVLKVIYFLCFFLSLLGNMWPKKRLISVFESITCMHQFLLFYLFAPMLVKCGRKSARYPCLKVFCSFSYSFLFPGKCGRKSARSLRSMCCLFYSLVRMRFVTEEF